MLDQKLFAFWEYDCLSGCLGGNVTKFVANSMVETREYGPGYRFTPCAIFLAEEGEELITRMAVLEEEYHKEEEKLRKKYEAKMKDLKDEYGMKS